MTQVKSGGWMPPGLKGFLSYANGTEIVTVDITKDVMNWNELDVSLKRDGLSGTFLSVEKALRIRGKAKQILNGLFMENGLHAKASFEIHRRDNWDLNKYTVPHVMHLEFTTYAEGKDYTEIEGYARNFNAMLASFGKLNYDIPVSELSPEIWTYKHNEMINVGNWTMPEIEFQYARYGGLETPRYVRPLINFDNAEMVLNGIENDFKIQSSGVREDDHFFECAEDNLECVLNIDFYYTSRTTGTTYAPTQTVRLWKIPTSGASTTIFDQSFSDGHCAKRLSITLNKGDRLCLNFRAGLTVATPQVETYLVIKKFNSFTLTYKDKSKSTESITVVAPESLLNNLLAKMGVGFRTYTGQIFWKDKPFRTMLAAAESVRNFEKANFHVNFHDFLDWMQFMGYEWDANEETGVLSFRERDYYFNESITALELGKNEMAALLIEADDTFAWSAIKVGYERQDYENTNGRFEPNGTYEYATDLETPKMNTSTYESISPFRADPVGIEILTWSRTKKTTDTDSDNDVFMIAMNKTATAGENLEYRDVQIRSWDENRQFYIDVFNAYFNPYFIALDNSTKFGVSAKIMRWVGTDVGREIALQGNSSNPHGDIQMPKGLFSPFYYQFAAGTHLDLPTGNARRGLVYFNWQGKRLRGFISELAKNYALDVETNWWLRGVK